MHTMIHLLPDLPLYPNRFSVTTRLAPPHPASSTNTITNSNSSHSQATRILFISVENIERREEWVTALREAIAQHNLDSSQSCHSAFALLSEPGQAPGWMNAMFEDDFLSVTLPSVISPVSEE